MSATKTRGRSTEPRDFGMYAAVTASPLCWPIGWPRTPYRERRRAKWGSVRQRAGDGYIETKSLSIAEAVNRLWQEVRLVKTPKGLWAIRVDDMVISSNLPTRADGLPYSDAREPDDPGVAVYFHLDGQPHCLPCDRWDKVAGNIAAIAAHVGAMRGMERWGVGSVAAAFAGFKALPPGGASGLIVPAMTVDQAARFVADESHTLYTSHEVLASADDFRNAYRAAAKRLHPDAGGSAEQFTILQDAKRLLEKHHGGGR